MPKYHPPQKIVDQIDNAFSYHPPIADQPERYVSLRQLGRDLATAIAQETPPGREQALAMTNLEQAIMWANAAIARGETETRETPAQQT